MTDVPRQPDSQQWPPSDLSRGEAIRLLADRELSESEIRSICSETFGEDAEARILCEQALRSRIAKVMGESAPPCPKGVREAVQRLCAGAGDEDAPPSIEIEPAVTRGRGFWSTARTLALAASLAMLVAASVLLWPGNPASPFAPTSAPFDATRARLATFIDSEHDKCATLGDYFDRKFKDATPAEAERFATEHLGVAPHRLSLESQGYRLAGIGMCAVPGQGASVHILYKSDRARSVSLFIQEAKADRELDPDICYCIPVEGGAVLQAWIADGLIYYLYSGEGSPPRDVRAALDAPEAELRLSGLPLGVPELIASIGLSS